MVDRNALASQGSAKIVMKKVVIAVVSVLVVLVAATFGAGWYMLDYALTPPADRSDMVKRYNRMYAEYPYMRQWVDSMKTAKALRDTFVTMPDGERHHAVYARNDSAAGRTAILVHGYTDSHAAMSAPAPGSAPTTTPTMLPRRKFRKTSAVPERNLWLR